MHHFQADLKLKDPASPPVFKKPRPVPFALKEAVGKELDRLEAQGIITKVNHSEWACAYRGGAKGRRTATYMWRLQGYNQPSISGGSVPTTET